MHIGREKRDAIIKAHEKGISDRDIEIISGMSKNSIRLILYSKQELLDMIAYEYKNIRHK